MATKKIIMVGDSAYAEVAYEYFTQDSPYEVAAFAVEKEFLGENFFCGLPVVDLEDVEKEYAPGEYGFHVAITYIQLNRVRARLVAAMTAKGFEPVSYVSNTVRLWPSVKIGRHCFIFENNVIQPGVTIGDNCVLWSGNHIGHHSTVSDNCFISSQVVLSGFSRVGDYSFIGVNATLADTVEIGADCFIGAGSVINKNLPDNTVTRPPDGKKVPGAKMLMGVAE